MSHLNALRGGTEFSLSDNIGKLVFAKLKLFNLSP